MANIITKAIGFTHGNAYFLEATKGSKDLQLVYIDDFRVLGEFTDEKSVLDDRYKNDSFVRLVAYNITGYSTAIWGVDIEDFISCSRVLGETDSRKNLVTRTITAYIWKFGRPTKDNTQIEWKTYTTGDKLTSRQANKKAQEAGYLFAVEGGEEKTLRGMTEYDFYCIGREVTR